MHPFGALAELGRERALVPALAIVVLYTLSQSVVQCTWALYTEFRYGWTPQAIGFSIFALGLSITFTQGWLLPKAARRLSPKRIVTIGLLVGLVALLGMGLSTSGPLAAGLPYFLAALLLVAALLTALASKFDDGAS